MNKHKDSVHEGIKPYKCHICQFESATSSHVKRHITFVHEKKKNEINISKSVGHLNDQEVSFQCIKNEPSETVDPLLIHEFKEESFEENEATPTEDLAPVYIKQEDYQCASSIYHFCDLIPFDAVKKENKQLINKM